MATPDLIFQKVFNNNDMDGILYEYRIRFPHKDYGDTMCLYVAYKFSGGNGEFDKSTETAFFKLLQNAIKKGKRLTEDEVAKVFLGDLAGRTDVNY